MAIFETSYIPSRPRARSTFAAYFAASVRNSARYERAAAIALARSSVVSAMCLFPLPNSVDVLDPKFDVDNGATVSGDHALGNRYLSNFRGRNFAPSLPRGTLRRLDKEVTDHSKGADTAG